MKTNKIDDEWKDFIKQQWEFFFHKDNQDLIADDDKSSLGSENSFNDLLSLGENENNTAQNKKSNPTKN